MKFYSSRVTDINIAYIGGGSRGWAWNLMSDLSAESDISGNVRLYDIDKQAATNNAIIGNSLKDRPDVKGDFTYKVADTLQEVLTGADFIIISILPGTFDEMESDVHLPEQYGIYQSVGDSTGPGGMIRALRTLPMYIEFAQAIKNYCPDAWVISYTNPMMMCVQMMYEVFPQIKAFGCCHEVFGTQHLIADFVSKERGIENIHRREIKVNVQGINHFTWINRATYDGEDIFPIYKRAVDKYHAEGYENDEAGHWMNSLFDSANRVKFDLFKRYGVIAAAGDRHLAEFCPPWYLKNPETVYSWKFTLTPVSYRKNRLKELLEESDLLVKGEKKMKLALSGEEGVMQIKAILGMGDMVTNVNIPNRGQIPNLPIGCVVETNAMFTKNNVVPLFADNVDASVNNLILRHVYNYKEILNAVVKKDLNLAFNAFANDPLMTADMTSAKILFNRMIENTKKYLQYYKQNCNYY